MTKTMCDVIKMEHVELFPELFSFSMDNEWEILWIHRMLEFLNQMDLYSML